MFHYVLLRRECPFVSFQFDEQQQPSPKKKNGELMFRVVEMEPSSNNPLGFVPKTTTSTGAITTTTCLSSCSSSSSSPTDESVLQQQQQQQQPDFMETFIPFYTFNNIQSTMNTGQTTVYSSVQIVDMVMDVICKRNLWWYLSPSLAHNSPRPILEIENMDLYEPFHDFDEITKKKKQKMALAIEQLPLDQTYLFPMILTGLKKELADGTRLFQMVTYAITKKTVEII